MPAPRVDMTSIRNYSLFGAFFVRLPSSTTCICSTCHREFDQRPFLVKTLQTCGPWIYVEPPKTRVGLDLEQMTVPAYEHIGSVGIEQAPDALGVAAWPTADVGHIET